MAIKFDDDLNKEIRRGVDNFNRRRKRALLQGVKYLPEKQSIKNIKEEFKGYSAKRFELRKYLKDLEGFNLKTAKATVELSTGELTSQYNFKRAIRQQKRLRKAIEKEIEEQERFVKRKPFLIMRRSRLNLLRNIKESLLSPIKSRDSLRSIQAEYTREFSPSRLDNFYEQFFDIMESEMKVIEFDEEKMKILKDKMMKVKPEILLKMRNNDNLIRQILDRYNSDEEYTSLDVSQMESLYNKLYKKFDEILEEYSEDEIL